MNDKKVKHLRRAENLADAHRASTGNHGQADALLAIFHTLEEIKDRMPEKPMQILSTPTPPVEDIPSNVIPFRRNSRAMPQLAFNCQEDENDGLVVTHLHDGGYEFYSTYGSDVRNEMTIVLSQEDAESLAKHILGLI